MIKGRRVAVAAALVVTSMILSACGGGAGGTGSGSAGSAPSGSSTGADPVQAKAQAKVAELLKGPASWPGPTEAFQPGTGKAAVIACGLAAAVCAEQADVAVEAIRAMGWQSDPPVDGQFSPSAQSNFIDRAIQSKLDGIVIVSVDIQSIKTAIDRAVAANLPVACIACSSITAEYTGHVINVTPSFEDQGVQGAWKVLADKGSTAKVVTSVDGAYLSTVERERGLTTTIKAECPSCTIDTFKFATGDIAKPGPPEWSGYLAAHPKGTFDQYVGHYDGMGIAAAKTAVQSGRTEISFGSYDGTPDALNAIASDKPPYQFTVAEPYTYMTWSGVDLLARVARGAPLWEGYDKLPNTLITKDNVKTFLAGMPAPSVFPAPQGDWQGTFKKFWGIAA